MKLKVSTTNKQTVQSSSYYGGGAGRLDGCVGTLSTRPLAITVSASCVNSHRLQAHLQRPHTDEYGMGTSRRAEPIVSETDITDAAGTLQPSGLIHDRHGRTYTGRWLVRH